ncbi:MAG: hypothetical protein LUF68_06670 [Clostridiales bacterium]|nr:hypothetical protein [Clostridiales bacterium]
MCPLLIVISYHTMIAWFWQIFCGLTNQICFVAAFVRRFVALHHEACPANLGGKSVEIQPFAQSISADKFKFLALSD